MKSEIAEFKIKTKGKPVSHRKQLELRINDTDDLANPFGDRNGPEQAKKLQHENNDLAFALENIEQELLKEKMEQEGIKPTIADNP